MVENAAGQLPEIKRIFWRYASHQFLWTKDRIDVLANGSIDLPRNSPSFGVPERSLIRFRSSSQTQRRSRTEP